MQHGNNMEHRKIISASFADASMLPGMPTTAGHAEAIQSHGSLRKAMSSDPNTIELNLHPDAGKQRVHQP